jgi:hypothetical protein
LDFYAFCDKDKSNKLNEDESTLGLLILYKYINKDLIENEVNRNILLPIVYQNERTDENEYFNKQDFETLIIDTLTEHIRIQTFQGPQYSHLKESPSEINKQIDNLSKAFQNLLTKDLKFSHETNERSPFIVDRTIGYLLLFVLSVILIPITLLILFRNKIVKENFSLKSRIQLLSLSIVILCCILISCIVYLTLINILLYYLYSNENSTWNVNSFEAYWPFALVIYLMLMFYVYLSEDILLNETEKKRKEFERIYNDAQIEMLKCKVKVTTMTGEQMTVEQFESIQGLVSKSNDSTLKRKSLSGKLKNFLIKIYKKEFENENICLIMLKVVGLILFVGVIVVHSCIPLIYRRYSNNKNELNITKPFEVELIEMSYMIISLPLYLIFILMIIYGFYKYKILYSQLNKIFRQSANDYQYNSLKKKKYYLNLKISSNLDLFFDLFRQRFEMNKRVDYRVRTIHC